MGGPLREEAGSAGNTSLKLHSDCCWPKKKPRSRVLAVSLNHYTTSSKLFSKGMFCVY